mmetsp:Transcript_25118/g.70025  ORF Transcript_25118/g.70025 Transcript_25118/m.70025 type:complete len:220 (-) Transcript_25118:386-1045(-)
MVLLLVVLLLLLLLVVLHLVMMMLLLLLLLLLLVPVMLTLLRLQLVQVRHLRQGFWCQRQTAWQCHVVSLVLALPRLPNPELDLDISHGLRPLSTGVHLHGLHGQLLRHRLVKSKAFVDLDLSETTLRAEIVQHPCVSQKLAANEGLRLGVLGVLDRHVRAADLRHILSPQGSLAIRGPNLQPELDLHVFHQHGVSVVALNSLPIDEHLIPRGNTALNH